MLKEKEKEVLRLRQEVGVLKKDNTGNNTQA
jgi:hypothetical protein